MKTLANFIQDEQTKAIEKHGAFFAFGQKQFNEKAKNGVEYVSISAGLICPKSAAASLVSDLEQIHEKGINQDLETNGKKAIIRRELFNHEIFITWDFADTMAALDGYGISESEVRAVFDEIRATENIDDYC
ncbi:MAG: hypothetical protein CMB99_16220 [Flavobacteriaceae bacterium]|nr:hypothetical protein [Flavobacteriaceae bacterium]|tara:strand:- start:14631 stop:15026 length:396 start_codon:yes stop_codon:yes gene_type:complete